MNVPESKQTTVEAPQPEPVEPVPPVCPLMYRVMKADGAYPMTGDTGTTLGARTPKDIKTDADGRVHPGTGGMSVRPRIADIPAMFLPRRLTHLNRNAGGSNNAVVWLLGEGPFAVATVTPDLSLRPDAPDHGVVEPTTAMDFDMYQHALWATRERWVNGEP